MENFNSNIAIFLRGDTIAATILEKIKYWTDYNSRNNRNFVDGYFWTYNTIEDWSAQLVFCSPKAFYKRISKLRKLGLIYTEKFNKKKGDQTLWYRVNNELYNKIINKDTTLCIDDNTSHTSGVLTHNENTQIVTQPSTFNDKGKMEIDFPQLGKSYRVTNNNYIRKKEVKRRGWYLPPNYDDYNNWTPPPSLRKTIEQDYGLTEKQIDEAHKEFVLYNNAIGTKMRSVVAMFTLWCKRFKAKLKSYIKKGTAKIGYVKEKAEVTRQKVMQFIEVVKEEVGSKLVHRALVDHFGYIKYDQLGLRWTKLKHCDKESEAIEFVNIAWSEGQASSSHRGDEAYKISSVRDQILSVLRRVGYKCNKVLIYGD